MGPTPRLPLRLAFLLLAMALVAAACGDAAAPPATAEVPAPVSTTEATPVAELDAGRDGPAVAPEEAASTVTIDNDEDDAGRTEDDLRDELELAKDKGTGDPPPTIVPPADQPPVDDRAAPPVEGKIPAGFEGIVAAASSDLAAITPSDAGPITVVSAESVVWPDSSLGCPQPGMAYTQVQVEGAKVVLARAGIQYAYHSDGRRTFLCR